MLERRRHSRIRGLAIGTIADGVPAGRSTTADCVVRNASRGGALLLLDEPRRAPATLNLATRDGVRPARVVWRGETGVGVAFLSAPLPAPTAPLAAPTAVVVDLDAARRRRVPGSDEARLAERIARFVRSSRQPDGA